MAPFVAEQRARRKLLLLTCLAVFLPLSASSSSSSNTVTMNPYQKGCLFSKNITKKIRVCGSEDSSGETSNCRIPHMDYPEIRLIPQDWESVMFSTWILQILLSELLEVPTSIEMGDTTSQLDFYHPDSPFDYPVTTNYMRALENASPLNGDCRQADRSSDGYQVCGHFCPEVWGGRKRDVQDMVHREVIESPLSVGQLAQEGWFIPRFTALRDPMLLSYLAYQGQDNRQKLAERFKRPTTWSAYCEQVSQNNCTTPDTVAQRAPQPEEADKMFAEGLYTGHFRATEKNNCTANPTTCTGHFSDYPCDWRSPVPQQLYHMDIALEPELDDGGYTYSQLIEIWRAANATKSDVILFWWSPQILYGEFQGTEAEFTRVALPAATQTCIEARVDTESHCSPILEERVGSPEGICMEPPNSLHSLISTSVYDQAYGAGDSTTSFTAKTTAEYSPSHDALSRYKLSELQIEDIFVRWKELEDPREAVCGWVADNMDHIEQFIPRGYPRSFEDKDEDEPLMYASTLIGAIVMVMVLAAFVAVRRYRHLRAIMHAQIEFLNLLLLGALLITIGSVVMGTPSSDASCIAQVWLVNVGYTLELVPLIVKIGAVLHVMDSGKKMRRVMIQRTTLFGAVACICTMMIIYLIVWTVVDPPQAIAAYDLTKEQNDDGETIVWVLEVCGSESPIWTYVSAAWNCFLLLVTTVLAIRMRKLNVKGFDETSTLALLVYSHFFFVILRVITYVYATGGNTYAVAHYQSMIFSVDTLATLAIYFVPKFLAEEVRRSGRISLIGSDGRRVSGLSFASEPSFRNGSVANFRVDDQLDEGKRNSRAVSFLDPSGQSLISSNDSSPFSVDPSPFSTPAEQNPVAKKVRKNTSNTSLASLAESAQEGSSDAQRPEKIEGGETDLGIGMDIDSEEEAPLMKRRIEDLERRNISLEKRTNLKHLD